MTTTTQTVRDIATENPAAVSSQMGALHDGFEGWAASVFRAARSRRNGDQSADAE